MMNRIIDDYELMDQDFDAFMKIAQEQIEWERQQEADGEA